MSSTPTVAWRALLPPFLTEPWRRFHSGEEPARRVGFGVAVVDVLGRYLVAVFSAAADSPEKTAEYSALLRRLDRPTLGMWWDAAERLAGFVAQDGGPVARAALAIRDPAVKRTLDALIGQRNEVAHPHDGVIGLSASDAEKLLRALADPLKRVTEVFSMLADARLCQVKRLTRVNGRELVDLVQFCAREPSFPKGIPASGLPTDVALLVEPSGRVLVLDPWVRVDSSHRDGATPYLFYRLEGAGAVWVAYDGMTNKGWAWLDPKGLPVQVRRRDRGLERVDAHRLCGMGEDRGSPTIPGWKVGGSIGSGGTSAVWRGRREGDPNGREYALKVVHDPLKSAPDLLERLRREVRLGMSLVHQNLVPVVEVAETSEGQMVVVQELIEGQTLEDQFVGGAPPSLRQLVAITREVLAALDYLHEKEVLHRDVKPSNVLIDGSGRARLADLGLAAAAVDHRLTSTGQGLGTPAFAAPEQLEGRECDRRSDVYGVGRVLQEGLRALHGPKLEGAPVRLRAVVGRATRPDPAERYATADEMRRELEAPDLLGDVCPLGPGDWLGGNRIERAGSRRGGSVPNVWEFEARDASGTLCDVLVGVDGPAGEWVRTAAKKEGPQCYVEGGFVFAAGPKGWGHAQQWGGGSNTGAMIGAGSLLLGVAAGLLAGGAVAATGVAATAAATTARRNAADKATSQGNSPPGFPASDPKAAPPATPPPTPQPKSSGIALLARALARGALRATAGPLAPTVEAAAKAKKGGPPKK